MLEDILDDKAVIGFGEKIRLVLENKQETKSQIQALVKDCLPEKRNQKEEESMGIQEGYTQGFNVAVDTIKENLKQKGLL